MLKNRFSQSLTKKDDDILLEDLQTKHKKFQTQFENITQSQEKFLQENEKESARMKGEN